MSQYAMVAVRAYLMNHLGKTLAWVVILFCATNQASLAVGPVDPDANPPIQCVADGICHINGCQETPDPDCVDLPDTSSPDTSSPDTSSPDTSCETVYEGEWGTKETDLVKLKGDQVKFGDVTWVPPAGVVGYGRVKWSVVCGFYTPELIGHIHLNNASGKYARMRLGYLGVAKKYAKKPSYSRTQYAADDKHYSWPVHLLPYKQVNIFKARVCTMISDDGEDFDEEECQTVEFD
jgi:hypothetical protein